MKGKEEYGCLVSLIVICGVSGVIAGMIALIIYVLSWVARMKGWPI